MPNLFMKLSPGLYLLGTLSVKSIILISLSFLMLATVRVHLLAYIIRFLQHTKQFLGGLSLVLGEESWHTGVWSDDSIQLLSN